MPLTSVTSAHPWDLSVNGIGLMIDPERDSQGEPGEKLIEGMFSPVDNEEQPSDRAAIWGDWSLGMGLPKISGGRGGYAYTLGAYTRRPGKLLPAPAVTEVTLPVSMASGVQIVDIRDFGDDIYLLTSGNQILRINDGDPTDVVVAETSGITSFTGKSLLPFRGELLASGEAGLEILRSGVWTPFSVPVSQLGVVTWFYQNQPKTWLLGVFDEYGFRRTDSDPSVWTSPAVPGNWSSFAAIGESSYPITGLAISNRVALFVKTNGVHTVDAAEYTANLTKYWEDYIDPASGSVTTVFNNKVFSTHAGILDRINVQDYQIIDESDYVHPGYGVEGTGPIFGDVTAACPDRGWLAAAVDNGTDSYLCFGRDPRSLRLDVNVPFIWHGAEAWWEHQYVTKLRLSNKGGRPRMWAATYDRTSGRARLWRIDRYRAADPYQAWRQGEDVEFQRWFSVVHLGESYGDSSSRKVPRRGDVTSENLGSDRTLQVFAQLDQTQPTQEDDDGNDQYTFIPPLDSTYTITIGELGTTTPLNGFLEDDASSAADIQTALEALDVSLVGVVAVAGSVTPFTITIPDGETITCSRGSLDWWIQGTASTSARQTFLPSESATNGFDVILRIDGHGQSDDPPIATSFKLRSSVLEDQIETKTYNVRFGPKVDNLDGSPDGRDHESVKSQLEALMSSGPVEVIDESNRVSIAKVEPGMRYSKRKRKHGYEYRLKFRISLLKRPFYWDSGASWDDIFIWSSP